MPMIGDPPRDGEIQVWRVPFGDGGRPAARAALGQILAAVLGVEAPPALTREDGGKPRLASDPERLSFNLSHSGALALVAVAPGGVEVGVDLERLRPRRDLRRLAARWLPAEEAEAVGASSDEDLERVFYAAWTRYEARVKCLGTGLAGPDPGPEVEAWPVEIDDGYAAAVALAAPGAEPSIVMRDWPAADE
jgi:4'-phosphopantetheinyl transferase